MSWPNRLKIDETIINTGLSTVVLVTSWFWTFLHRWEVRHTTRDLCSSLMALGRTQETLHHSLLRHCRWLRHGWRCSISLRWAMGVNNHNHNELNITRESRPDLPCPPTTNHTPHSAHAHATAQNIMTVPTYNYGSLPYSTFNEYFCRPSFDWSNP